MVIFADIVIQPLLQMTINAQYAEKETLHIKSVLVYQNKGKTTMTETMTQEQIRICREYLEVVELCKEYIENSVTFGCPFDQLRANVHFELLQIYGFDTESDTLEVTSNIPDGMTPRQLHDELMKLKQNNKQ